jgi:hypothetical protein
MKTKQVSWSEFLDQFEKEVHEDIATARKRPGVDGIACMVCQMMDSSRFGRKTALIYGPGCTYSSIEMIEAQQCGVYLTGLPSSASFPITHTTDLPK